jgi:hypothetical protein
MALRQAASIASLRAHRDDKKKKKGDKDDDKDDDDDDKDDDDKENDDVVKLFAEHKGDSKAPKVTKDDLPKGIKFGKSKKEKS